MKIQVDVHPFAVPNYVILNLPGQFPRSETPKLELKDVGAERLDTLCEEFRAAVFKKAGKVDQRFNGKLKGAWQD